MATIVQPYNPWREQLALTALGNVAGNIIGDIWKTHRQNEQNRKANAFRGQLQQNLQNNAQPEISLIPKEAPQGYNSNPWANAFHQNNSPLTAFDIGTSTVGKTPSIQDIMRTADNLAATPRFSMLGQDVVQGAKNSLIQNTIANMFSNAGDIQGQMNALTMGAALGGVAPQVLTAFVPYARDVLSPYTFQESDLGQNKVISALNKITGMATPGMVMPVSVSPDTAANNTTSRYVADRSAESSRYASDTQRYGYDSTSQWRNRELEDEERQREYERQNPPQTIYTDAEGNVQAINTRTGTATNVRDEAGNQVTGETGHYQIDVARMNALNKQYQELVKQKQNLQFQLSITDDSKVKQYFMNEISKIDAEMKENWKETNEIHERNKRKPKTATTPMPAGNTPGGFMASADVQPVQTTQSASSADVRPTVQDPHIATQSGLDNSLSASIRRNIIPQISALSNTSADVRPVTPQAPAPAQLPAKKKNTVSFPTSAVYDPSRDANVSADMIKSLSDLYSDYINYKNQLNLPPTFQEFLNNCIKDGVKIRHETRK